MDPQMATGVLTNANFQFLMVKCPNEEILAVRMSEHAAQVTLELLVLKQHFPEFLLVSEPYQKFTLLQLWAYSGYLRAWAAK